jgi:IclR family acetate operon transcriptional repressor
MGNSMAETVGEEATSAPGDAAYSIRAVQRVCDLLDLLQREPDGTSLARAAEVTSLPKSSAFRYLATLETRRYVERDPKSGDFRLGMALLPMQARRLDLLTLRVRPYLSRLQAEFGETANLGFLDGNSVIYLAIVESGHAMRLAPRPGDRDPLHSTALGKALATALPKDRVQAILRAGGMKRMTERTITTQAAFFDELERVRRAGYALDDGENEVGARCVAAAMPGGDLPLAISVAGPAARFEVDQAGAVGARLIEIIDELGAQLRTDADAGD